MKEKRILQVWLALMLVGSGLVLAVGVLLQNVWAIIVSIGLIAFCAYLFNVRYYQKKRPRYPLVPPEGRGDAYSPRTNIPRPIYEDAREMREKERKFAKLAKMRRKKR
jgi:hypothetical protein